MKTYDLQIPQTKHPEVGLLLGVLEDSTREWLDNLEEPTVEAITWQSFPNAPSIGAELLHLIDTEAYWFETFLARRRRPAGETALLLAKETRVDSGSWPTPPAEPLEWYLGHLRRIRARAWNAIKDMAPTDFRRSEKWEMSVRWVIGHVIQHDSYHGGQAVLLHEQFKRLRKSSDR